MSLTCHLTYRASIDAVADATSSRILRLGLSSSAGTSSPSTSWLSSGTSSPSTSWLSVPSGKVDRDRAGAGRATTGLGSSSAYAGGLTPTKLIVSPPGACSGAACTNPQRLARVSSAAFLFQSLISEVVLPSGNVVIFRELIQRRALAGMLWIILS